MHTKHIRMKMKMKIKIKQVREHNKYETQLQQHQRLDALLKLEKAYTARLVGLGSDGLRGRVFLAWVYRYVDGGGTD